MPTSNGSKAVHSVATGPVTGLRFQGGRLIVLLEDGREVSVPLDRYPTLLKASPRERARKAGRRSAG